MWMVIACEADRSARWAAAGLRERGLSPLHWISAEALPGARLWDHRVGRSGATVELELADGRVIRGEDVRGVLNRLPFIPPGHALRFAPADRLYVQQEVTSFYLSWLYALPGRVVNAPTPQGLCGAMHHPSRWLWLAARAGLGTAPYRRTSDQPWRESWDAAAGLGASPAAGGGAMLFVVGDEVIVPAGEPAAPEPPEGVRAASVRLGRLAEAELLGLRFAVVSPGRWVFVTAEVDPPLEFGGEPLLDALARTLTAAPRGAAGAAPGAAAGATPGGAS